MNPFQYQRATSEAEAVRAAAENDAKLLGGGINLVDLMRYGVEKPARQIDITRLDLSRIEGAPSGGVLIGALVRNSELASDARIVKGGSQSTASVMPAVQAAAKQVILKLPSLRSTTAGRRCTV